jgi:hypothetical protein
MTVTQTFVMNATTTAEYTEFLLRANAWRTAVPSIVASVVAAAAQRRVTITIAAQPFVFDTPTWLPPVSAP